MSVVEYRRFYPYNCFYFCHDATSDYDKVRVAPHKQTSYGGEDKQFFCFSRREIKWSFKGHQLPRNAKTENAANGNRHILTIKDITRSNSGTYQCHGRGMTNIAEGVLEFKGDGKDDSFK